MHFADWPTWAKRAIEPKREEVYVPPQPVQPQAIEHKKPGRPPKAKP